jgi:hypothetical protein
VLYMGIVLALGASRHALVISPAEGEGGEAMVSARKYRPGRLKA